MAHDDAEMAFEQAESAKNQSESIRAELKELILAITEFLEQHGARPEDIRTVCGAHIPTRQCIDIYFVP